MVAAVIRGHAPADFRAEGDSGRRSESYFGSALDHFQGDAAPFRAADGRLPNLLVTRYREKPETSKPRMAIAVGILLLLLAAAWIGYVTYAVHKWSEFARALGQHPGIVVVSYSKSGGRCHVQGFRDPLAADPSVDLAQPAWIPTMPICDLVPFLFARRRHGDKARPRRSFLHHPTVELADHGGESLPKVSAPHSVDC